MNQRQRLLLATLAQGKTIGFPDLQLPGVSSDTVRLSSLMGKVVIVSFWRSDIPACLIQNREYVELYKRFEKKGLRIYQVSLTPTGQNGPLLCWMQVIHGSVSGAARLRILLRRLYNVQQLPSEYVINREGEIVAVNPDPDNLAGIVTSLLR
jgi:peroxiredoxin